METLCRVCGGAHPTGSCREGKDEKVILKNTVDLFRSRGNKFSSLKGNEELGKFCLEFAVTVEQGKKMTREMAERAVGLVEEWLQFDEMNSKEEGGALDVPKSEFTILRNIIEYLNQKLGKGAPEKAK